MQDGFAFHWRPHQNPLLIAPDGQKTTLEVANFVPIMTVAPEITVPPECEDPVLNTQEETNNSEDDSHNNEQPGEDDPQSDQIEENNTLPGETVTDAMIALIDTLSNFPGWTKHEGRPTYVEGRAVAYRTPYPRHPQEKFPLRSTYAAYQVHDVIFWRELEHFVRYAQLPVSNALIGKSACQLITMVDTQGAIPRSAEQQPTVLIDPTHA